MTLTPIKAESIFKSADPEFNYRAAQAAYDLVMKMHEDQARMFTSIVVADVTEEIIEKNLRTVQAHLDKVVSKRMQDVKRAVIAKAKDSPDAVPFAQALALIEKAQRNPYDYGYTWQESDFNRDPGSGQFRAKITHSQKNPISDRTAATLGIPTHAKRLSSEQKAQFQDEYRQLASFLNSVTMSTRNPGDSKVVLHVENKATGQRSFVENNGTNADATKWNPATERLVGAEARPSTLTVGGAAFGLMPALGERGTGQINAATDEQAIRSFSDDWLRTDTHNANARTYNRIKAGSDYLSGVAPAGSKLQMASAFGSFVGNMGPEAENVIGPTARKTAYRYRGTEKAPDKALVGGYGRGISHAKGQTANDPYRNTPEGKRANLKAPSTLSPSQMAQARVAAEGRAPTWDERKEGRKVIHAYLEKKIPNKRLYGLQLAAGNTPPSQGVLLNKDGQIVTEAVGYGDDHYIPFNLKNLKELKGGEYIRTRSVGGLTSEDIYVGLMTGARQVQVVSRSGTFTVTFNEDFKGGRRYNDKAARMTRRYEQILDAVQSEQVDRGDVDPEIRQIITNKVEEELGEYASVRDKRSLVKTRIEEYKAEGGELTEEDEILINAMARAALRDGRSQDEKDYRKQVTGEILARKQTRFRLDGHGYKASLEALEEQFPYYITVNAVPTDEHDVLSLERDKGYVEAGRNRPSAANAGTYGTAQNAGTGFISASQVNYQGSTSHVSRPATSAAAEATSQTPGAAGATGAKFDASKFRASPTKEKVDTTTPPPQFVPAATQLADTIKSYDTSDVSAEDKAVLNYGEEDLKNPGKAARFNDLVTYFHEQSANGLGDSWTRYQAAKGAFGMRPYEEVHRGTFSNVPFAFDGAAYQGKNVAAKHAELKKIDGRSPGSLFGSKRYSEMSQSELAREHSALTQVYNTMDAAGNPADPTVRANVLKSMGVDLNAPATKLLKTDPAKAGDFIDDVQRTNAIIHNMTDEERKPPVVIHSGTGEAPQGPKAGANKLIEGLERAASHREKQGLEDEADEFRIIASALKDQTRHAVSEADIKSFMNVNEDTIQRAMEAIHEARQ